MSCARRHCGLGKEYVFRSQADQRPIPVPPLPLLAPSAPEPRVPGLYSGCQVPEPRRVWTSKFTQAAHLLPRRCTVTVAVTLMAPSSINPCTEPSLLTLPTVLPCWRFNHCLCLNHNTHNKANTQASITPYEGLLPLNQTARACRVRAGGG